MTTTPTVFPYPISIFSQPAYDEATELARLRRQVAEQRAILENLREEPTQVGVVIDVYERDGQKFVMLAAAGATIEKRVVNWSKDVVIGMTAKMLQKGAHPIEFGAVHTGGMVATVTAVHEKVVEFTIQGVDRSATTGVPCKVGDRVQLDANGQVVVSKLSAATSVRVVKAATGIDWDDIGGLDDVKRKLRDAIEGPALHPETYQRFGKKAVKGIGLWGPSGTGKTMLGKAAATALSKCYGKSSAETGFILVKGPDLLHPLIGQSESNVRDLFSSARAHKAEHGYPAVIFIDEAESVMGVRGANKGWEGPEKTVVPMFLTEMDGFDQTGAIIIIATNRPEAIDPAFRQGRIDRWIEVPNPTQAACVDIARKCLKGRPAAKDLPEALVAELFNERYVLGMADRGKGRERLTLGSWGPSGAMVDGLVELACDRAIARSLVGKKPDTITIDDVKESLPELVATTTKRLEGQGVFLPKPEMPKGRA